MAFPTVHLARFSRESVSGVLSCRPPGTVFLRECSRWHLPAFHLARYSRESVPGVTSRLPTWHGIPAKAFQVAFPTVHLARYSCKSVPGVSSPPSTWHGIPAKAFQVGDFFWRFRALCNVGAFQQDKLVVFSMKRVAVCTPAVREYMHLSENHDVQKKVQLQVSHI